MNPIVCDDNAAPSEGAGKGPQIRRAERFVVIWILASVPSAAGLIAAASELVQQLHFGVDADGVSTHVYAYLRDANRGIARGGLRVISLDGDSSRQRGAVMFDVYYPDGTMRSDAPDLWAHAPDKALPDGMVARSATIPPQYFKREDSSWIAISEAEGKAMVERLRTIAGGRT